MRDLDFLSDKHSEYSLSKEQKYLLKYFKTPLQQAFLKYFFVFGETSCFVEHTGYFTTKSYLYRQTQKLNQLLEAHATAKSSMDLDTLWKIESGKYYGKDDQDPL